MFFINKFYLFGNGQTFGSGVRPLNKFFFCKINVFIAEDKEKHIQDHFHINVSYQKSLLKKPGPAKLIVDPKAN